MTQPEFMLPEMRKQAICANVNRLREQPIRGRHYARVCVDDVTISELLELEAHAYGEAHKEWN